MILVFDTETTGFVNDRLPATDPSQPYLVQVAAKLMDASGTEYQSLSLIVKPDGWTIPAQASAVHKITTELATRVGLPLRIVVAMFTQLRALAEETVAHNNTFDMLVIDAQLAKMKVTPGKPWPAVNTCTMRGSAELVGLPPTPRMIKAGFTKNKPPNLTELHTFLFGQGFGDAHNALADVNACAGCFIELRKRMVL